MNERMRRFVQLIDDAINIAEKRKTLRAAGVRDIAPCGASENIVNALTQLKNEAVTGTLESSGGVVTIGVLREVADWGEPSESELFQAANAIETYYLENI